MKKKVSWCQFLEESFSQWITNKSVEGVYCLRPSSLWFQLWLPKSSFHGLSMLSPLFSKLASDLSKVDTFRSQRRLQLDKDWEQVWHLTHSVIPIPASSVFPYHIAYSSVSGTLFCSVFYYICYTSAFQLDDKPLGGRKNPSSFLSLHHIYI